MTGDEADDQTATSGPPIRVQVEASNDATLLPTDAMEDGDAATVLVHVDTELTDLAPDFSDGSSNSDEETELTELTHTHSDAGMGTTPIALEFDITDNETKKLMMAYPFGICNQAMPFQYYVSGFIGAMLTGVLYGILIGNMAVDANYYVASQAVVLVPWGFKCFIGFLSDNFPLLGRRRVYYCVMGHTIVSSTFIGLTAFYEDPIKEYCDAQLTVLCNRFATRHVNVVVTCFLLVCTGLVLSESACDGLMIQVCKEQIGQVRKAKVASVCFAIRLVGAATAATLILFGHDLPLRVMFVACASLSILSTLLWLRYAQYDQYNGNGYGNQTSCNQFGGGSRLFDLCCTPRFSKFMVYNLFAPMLVNITSPSMGVMRMYWSPTGHQQFTFVVSSFFTISMLSMITTWFLRAKWLHIVLVTTTVTVCITLPISVFAALNICRSEYIFLVQDVLQPLPAASMYLVATLATVDIAPPGQEATVYGLVTTAHILAIPSAKSIANLLYAQIPIFFGLSGKDPFFQHQNYTTDSVEFRQAVVTSVVISASAMMLSQLFLLLFPANRNRPTDSGADFKCGILTILLIALMFTMGMSLNMLTMIPHVRCSGAIRGIGCTPDHIAH